MCMSSKLALAIDQKVIHFANKYARNQGCSVSNIVETYLKTLAEVNEEENDFSPRLKSLIGAVSLPEDTNYKDLLTDPLQVKYSAK
jgi:hypothetical protein